MDHAASLLRRVIPVALLLLGCQPEDQTEPEDQAEPTAAPPDAAVAFEGPQIAVQPNRTLHPVAMLAVPDTTPESEWLNVVADMRYDASSGTMFTMDRMAGTLAEVDTLGTLVHLYGGGIGAGPHEVRNWVDYSFSSSSVVFLDRGNRKVMVFPRLGSRLDPFPVSTTYRSIALAGDETILLAPGTGAHAVDVYSMAGDPVGGIGAFGELPVRCTPEEDCDRIRRMCMGCVVRVVGDAVVVMNAEMNLLTVYGAEGEPVRSVDLRARIPLLREWIATDEPYLARMQERANARSSGATVAIALKRYFSNAHTSPDGRLAFSINPATPILQASGFQYWLLDIETLEVESAMFSDPADGMRATGWPTVFGVQRESYAIYRLEG